MKFFSNFFSALSNCFKGFTLIFGKGLWPYLIYPLFIWLATWLFTILSFGFLANAISNYLSFESIPESGHWLSFVKPFLTSGFFALLLSWVLKIIFWFVSATFSKYILLIVLSPLFALLSERTDEALSGNKFPFSFLQLLKDIGRGILISIRNMLFEFLFIAISFILGIFFPPSIIITTPLLVFISWYYTGFTMLDYNSERHKSRAGDSIKFIRNNKGYACGIGCVYWLFMILPSFAGDIVGLMFGPALAVIGATISYIEIKKPSHL